MGKLKRLIIDTEYEWALVEDTPIPDEVYEQAILDEAERIKAKNESV